MNAHLTKERPVLSIQQMAVIDWVLKEAGHLELLARAGCGKTFTLMQVVEIIVKNNLGDVALLAFNKNIATEIKGKLEEAKYDWRTAQAGTTHSFGFGVWRKTAPTVKVDEDKVFNIIRQFADVESPANPELSNIWLESAHSIRRLVSFAKQRALGHLCSIDDTRVWEDIWEHNDLDSDSTELHDISQIIECAKKVYRVSLNKCREIIDFDDMILAPLVFKARFWPKDWILIDEAQDTNPARRALALAMVKPRTGRVIFVGDDKQAINGFAGADNDAMQQLKNQLNATTLLLNVTRRCPLAVVNEAQKLVPDFVAHSSNPQGVVRNISFADLALESLGKHDVILCRNVSPLIQTAYGLFSKGIACRVEGREIGTGLITLARRWKVKKLDALLTKLETYQARETAKFMSKGQEVKIARLDDQIECLRIIIARQLSLKQYSVDEMVESISSMFGSTTDGATPQVLTLSTIHKSKGREWDRVFALGRRNFLPSPYAKKPWQLEQEKHLEYVLITRAKKEFVDVTKPD